MWSERLKEIKKTKNIHTKQIAEMAQLSERTVANVFAGKDGICLDSLIRVLNAMDVSFEEVFAESKATIGGSSFTELQLQLSTVTAEKETITAAHDLLIKQNEILETKITSLNAEIELLKLQLKHKEELIAVHNYYIKKLENA